MRFVLSCSCILLACGSLLAQTGVTTEPTIRRGMLSAIPLGVSLAEPGTNSIRMKAAFDQPNPPAPLTSPAGGHPDFSPMALFGSLAASIVLDAFSTGNDFIPALQGAFLPVPPRTWITTLVTVAWAGQPPLGGVTADSVLGYYYKGSEGLDPSLASALLLEQDRTHLGLSTSQELHAIDFGLAAIHTSPDLVPLIGQQPTPVPWISTTNRFYFSLSPACIPSLPAAFGSGAPITPSMIYRLEWQAGSWQGPFVEYDPLNDPVMTGFSISDIDALAVDPTQNTIMFSTNVVPGLSQILVVRDPMLATQAGPIEAAIQPGPLTEKLGILNVADDVRGICNVDPEGDLGRIIGTPWSHFPNFTALNPELMGLSVVRRNLGTTLSSVLLQSTGQGHLADPLMDAVFLIQFCQLLTFSNPACLGGPTFVTVPSIPGASPGTFSQVLDLPGTLPPADYLTVSVAGLGQAGELVTSWISAIRLRPLAP